MAIRFRCGQCGKTYSVAESMAGKKGKCKNCGSIMLVPAPAEPAAPEADPGIIGFADVPPAQGTLPQLPASMSGHSAAPAQQYAPAPQPYPAAPQQYAQSQQYAAAPQQYAPAPGYAPQQYAPAPAGYAPAYAPPAPGYGASPAYGSRPMYAAPRRRAAGGSSASSIGKGAGIIVVILAVIGGAVKIATLVGGGPSASAIREKVPGRWSVMSNAGGQFTTIDITFRADGSVSAHASAVLRGTVDVSGRWRVEGRSLLLDMNGMTLGGPVLELTDTRMRVKTLSGEETYTRH